MGVPWWKAWTSSSAPRDVGSSGLAGTSMLIHGGPACAGRGARQTARAARASARGTAARMVIMASSSRWLTVGCRPRRRGLVERARGIEAQPLLLRGRRIPLDPRRADRVPPAVEGALLERQDGFPRDTRRRRLQHREPVVHGDAQVAV